VIRGGGWVSDASECRTAFRNALEPLGQGGNVGFRVAADPPGKLKQEEAGEKAEPGAEAEAATPDGDPTAITPQ
jgi:hypothetical protein